MANGKTNVLPISFNGNLNMDRNETELCNGDKFIKQNSPIYGECVSPILSKRLTSNEKISDDDVIYDKNGYKYYITSNYVGHNIVSDNPSFDIQYNIDNLTFRNSIVKEGDKYDYLIGSNTFCFNDTQEYVMFLKQNALWIKDINGELHRVTYIYPIPIELKIYFRHDKFYVIYTNYDYTEGLALNIWTIDISGNILNRCYTEISDTDYISSNIQFSDICYAHDYEDYEDVITLYKTPYGEWSTGVECMSFYYHYANNTLRKVEDTSFSYEATSETFYTTIGRGVTKNIGGGTTTFNKYRTLMALDNTRRLYVNLIPSATHGYTYLHYSNDDPYDYNGNESHDSKKQALYYTPKFTQSDDSYTVSFVPTYYYPSCDANLDGQNVSLFRQGCPVADVYFRYQVRNGFLRILVCGKSPLTMRTDDSSKKPWTTDPSTSHYYYMGTFLYDGNVEMSMCGFAITDESKIPSEKADWDNIRSSGDLPETYVKFGHGDYDENLERVKIDNYTEISSINNNKPFVTLTHFRDNIYYDDVLYFDNDNNLHCIYNDFTHHIDDMVKIINDRYLCCQARHGTNQNYIIFDLTTNKSYYVDLPYNDSYATLSKSMRCYQTKIPSRDDYISHSWLNDKDVQDVTTLLGSYGIGNGINYQMDGCPIVSYSYIVRHHNICMEYISSISSSGDYDVYYDADGGIPEYKFSYSYPHILTYRNELEGAKYNELSWYPIPLFNTKTIQSYTGKYAYSFGTNSYIACMEGTTPLLSYYVGSLVDKCQALFAIQSQYYGIIDGYICSLDFKDNVISSMRQIISCDGMEFLGAFPKMAFLYSPKNKSIYIFTGDASLQIEYHCNKIREIKWTKYISSLEWILVNTDDGLYVITQDNIFKRENVIINGTEFDFVSVVDSTKGLIFKFEHNNDDSHMACYDLVGMDRHDVDSYPPISDDDLYLTKINPITMKTSYITSDSVSGETVSVIDCFYIRLFKDDFDEGMKVRIRTSTLNDVCAESEWSVITPKFDTNGQCLIKYQPKLQRGVGVSLEVESYYPISRISYSMTEQAYSMTSQTR